MDGVLRLFACCIMVCVAGERARAGDHGVEDAYLSVFYGMCLNADFRDHLMRAMAAGEGWQKIPEDTARTLIGGDWSADISAWVVDIPEQAPQFVGISAKSPPGELPAVELCGAYFPGIDGRYFIETLLGDTGGKIVEKATTGDGGQSYEITVPDLPSAVVSVAHWPKGAGAEIIVASVTFWGR